MAKARAAERESRVRRQSASYEAWSGLDEEKPIDSRGNERVTHVRSPANQRRTRIERPEGSSSSERSSSTPKMTSESHATLPSLKSSPSHRRRRNHNHSSEEKSHRRRQKSSRDDEPTTTYVYGSPEERSKSSRIKVSGTRILGRDEESSLSDEDEEDDVVQPRRVRDKAKKIRVIYISKEESRAFKRKERRVRTERESSDRPRDREESAHKSKPHRSRRKSIVEAPPASPPKRSASAHESHAHSRPSIRRSHTTSSHLPSSKHADVPSTSGTHNTNKRSSFLGSFFGPSAQNQREPEKLVECLTCLSDDIPRSKSAKLKCGHRMCHSCLKRIFRLSVTDPQHMPPKCCTADHIPLKHVEKLFDVNFKKLWNRKFQEYSTKNRIYCPARRCGEWIKPGNIHKEDGKKYGKCSRCKTKVCCLCNGKWHGTKDCPKDEETNRLLETAKQAGWQRCYNCRTMVELKEGCNHMTCRCTAEFCMICGLKWKSCNCPWFNYDAVEADRLNHMQLPVEIEEEQAPERPRRVRRPRPNTYHDEMDQRRRQERMDEEFARRVQRMALDGDDFQGGIGDIHGIGNGAEHFMNQDYVRAAHNIITGNFDQATAAANYVMGVANARGVPPPPPFPGRGGRRMADRYPASPREGRVPSPPPIRRRHTMREQVYNLPQTRPTERVVPRRTRTDYEFEAAVHAPRGVVPQRSSSRREPRPSVLAGLGGSGRGSGRVNAWRTHVEPGVTPEEGVLSV